MVNNYVNLLLLILLARIAFNWDKVNPSGVFAVGEDKFTIAVLSSPPNSTIIEKALGSAVFNANNLRFLNGTTFRIQLFYLENLDSSLKSSLVDFCKDVIRQNVSAVLIADDISDRFNFIPWIATRIGIPTTLVNNIRHFAANQEQEFSTVFSMKPKVSEQSSAIVGLLGFFRWTQFTVISTTRDPNPDETNELFRKLIELKQLRTMITSKINTQNQKDLIEKLEDIKKSEAVVIILHCSAAEAKTVLDSAEAIGLVGGNHAWIVTDYVMENTSGVSDLPTGLLGLQLRGPCEEEQLLSDLVYDSVMVYAHAVQSVVSTKGSLPRPPSSCYSNENYGASRSTLFSNIIKTKVKNGKTGPIEIDSQGNRINADYNILNLRQSTNGRKEWIKIGFWSEGKINCNRSPVEWPGRRKDPPPNIFHSKVIRVVTAITEPFTYFSLQRHNYDNGARTVCAMGFPCRVYQPKRNGTMTVDFKCCQGLVIDLLRMLENDVGFKAELHVVKDGKYGGQDMATRQWNGLIGELIRGEADVAIADLTITDARSRVVDFTHPFLHVGINILVAVRKKRSGWLVRFMEPFSTELWLVTIVTINIVFLVLWIIDKLSPYGHFRKGTHYKERKKFHLIASLWFTWGTIFHIDECETRPKSYSSRTITVVFAFGMLTVTNTYTANLAAVLVSEGEVLPVSSAGIQDPKLQNPPKGFKIATVKETSMEKVFRGSHDPVFAGIWRHMKPHGVDTFAEGVKKVINGEISAFVGDEPTLRYSISRHRNCNLRLAGKSFFQSGFGLAMRKNSTLTKKFSKVLILYEEYDTSRKLAHRWLSGSCSRVQETRSTFKRMAYDDLGGVYVIMSIGLFLSILILGVEFHVAKFGFPLSHIWTNKPHRSWPSSRTLHKRTIQREEAAGPSTAPLELSFGQRRFTLGEHREMEEINDDVFYMGFRGSFPQIPDLGSFGNVNRCYAEDDEHDSGMGSLSQNIEKSAM